MYTFKTDELRDFASVPLFSNDARDGRNNHHYYVQLIGGLSFEVVDLPDRYMEYIAFDQYQKKLVEPYPRGLAAMMSADTFRRVFVNRFTDLHPKHRVGRAKQLREENKTLIIEVKSEYYHSPGPQSTALVRGEKPYTVLAIGMPRASLKVFFMKPIRFVREKISQLISSSKASGNIFG
jgi:hypothetical protein